MERPSTAEIKVRYETLAHRKITGVNTGADGRPMTTPQPMPTAHAGIIPLQGMSMFDGGDDGLVGKAVSAVIAIAMVQGSAALASGTTGVNTAAAKNAASTKTAAHRFQIAFFIATTDYQYFLVLRVTYWFLDRQK